LFLYLRHQQKGSDFSMKIIRRLGMVLLLLATQTNRRFVVQGLTTGQTILSQWKKHHGLSAGLRHMSIHHANDNANIDPAAQLSSFTTLQKEFQLPQISKDRLPLNNQQRLVCFGDVHGDIHALKRFFSNKSSL
jgi:hypothetical protein